MILSLLFSILIPIATGSCLVCVLWPGPRSLRPYFLFKISLAAGLGLGVTSCIFFIWLCVFGAVKGFIALEAVILICLAAVLICFPRQKGLTISSAPGLTASSRSMMNAAIIAFFYIILGSALVVFISSTLREPHGGWDAWGVWNNHARHIFRAGNQWKIIFSNAGIGNPDYPLLIPATIARIWKLIGSDTIIVPAFIGMLFTFGTVAILCSSLIILRGKREGFLAAIVLLGTSLFVIWGARQYADIPLGFFILTTIALFSLRERMPEKNDTLLVLAGLAAGCAAWTKNEGLLFAALIIPIHFAALFFARGWKMALRQLVFFGIGLAPILLIIAYFKAQLAPPNVYVASISDEVSKGVVAQSLSGASKYALALKIFAKEIFNYGECVISPVPLLAVCLLFFGIRIDSRDRLNIITALITLCLMLGGYFFLYVRMPIQEILRVLSTTAMLDRLFLQLWPSFIFIYFMTARTDEEANR